MSTRGTPNKCIHEVSRFVMLFILIRSVNIKNGRLNEGLLVVVVSAAFS